MDGQNGKEFEFDYEYVSAKTLPKDPSRLLFEAMIKVSRSSFFESHKKIYPKLMYFYHLLKSDAPMLYYSIFGKTPIGSQQNGLFSDLNSKSGVSNFNDRRDRMTPTDINVSLLEAVDV
jgi:hypothetical protein